MKECNCWEMSTGYKCSFCIEEEEQDKWIDIENKKQPTYSKEYICVIKHWFSLTRRQFILYKNTYGQWIYAVNSEILGNDWKVTHWQEKPSLPKLKGE